MEKEKLEERTQEKYMTLISQGKISEARRLQRETGIKPVISEEALTSAYEKIIEERDAHDFIGDIEGLFYLTDRREVRQVAEDIVQKAYVKIVPLGSFNSVCLLQDVFGINATEETAQKMREKAIAERPSWVTPESNEKYIRSLEQEIAMYNARSTEK